MKTLCITLMLAVGLFAFGQTAANPAAAPASPAAVISITAAETATLESDSAALQAAQNAEAAPLKALMQSASQVALHNATLAEQNTSAGDIYKIAAAHPGVDLRQYMPSSSKGFIRQQRGAVPSPGNAPRVQP
jgi:hypothetical protein